MPDQSQLRKAASIQKAFLDGALSHRTAQQRLTWTGYTLNDPALLAELHRQDAEQQAQAEAAEAKRRRQDQRVNDYLRRERERSRGIAINGW